MITYRFIPYILLFVLVVGAMLLDELIKNFSKGSGKK